MPTFRIASVEGLGIGIGLALLCAAAAAQAPATVEPARPPYDAELARSVGADERGMRAYVLVVLRSGPTPVAAGPARDAMFKGHFANIERLARDGKLVLAGPFDGVDGWRGLFVFATPEINEARALVATDPVIAQGEMVAEFHRYYGSASLMLVREGHDRITKNRPR